ncbi:MAG: Secretion system C-terminal sorting domain, partial [Bacteroidota bacterium]
AIPFNQDSILVFHPYADYLNSTNVLATGNTLWRKVLNDQGEILSERSYMDSLKDVRLTDLEINNERIYVTGQKWSYAGLFNHAFLLVTNLEGDVLNYREMHVDSCFACQSQFGDLEFDSFGNLYGFGISINSDENVVSNWLRKFDCLGNDSTPPLNFNPHGILHQDGSIDIWLEDEAFETHHWEVEGNAIYADTLHIQDWFANTIDLTIYASYCELEFDTTLTLELAVDIPILSAQDFQFLATPNPASTLLNITFNSNKTLSGKLVFVNAQGQRVRESGTITVSPQAPTTISQNVSSLPRGLYIVSFETTEGVTSHKVVLE